MDDTQKRLTAVEAAQVKTDTSLQGLATKTELSDFRGEVRARFGAIEALLPHLATKTDVADVRGEMNRIEGALTTALVKLHASIIRWVVGTGISVVAVAIAIAKLIH